MKCARCGKSLDKAFNFVGGLPIGPKCWDKLASKPAKFQHIKATPSEGQIELFERATVPIPIGDSLDLPSLLG